MVKKGPGASVLYNQYMLFLAYLPYRLLATDRTEGREEFRASMAVLTTLINHFTTSITELMGMERPFPPADLPKGDQHGGHRGLGYLCSPLNARNAFN